jgi:hypothetical protein
LFVFAGSLSRRTQPLGLSGAEQASLQTEAQKLSGAAVPADIPANEAPAVGQSIKLSFVDTFRTVMLICAGLAWLSALAAALQVSNQPQMNGVNVDKS